MTEEEKATLKHIATQVNDIFSRCDCEFKSPQAKTIFNEAKKQAVRANKVIFNNI